MIEPNDTVRLMISLLLSLYLMMQAQPVIVCHIKDAEYLTDDFVFEYTATEQTEWNSFDISSIIENTEVDLQVTPITEKNLVSVLK